MKGNQMYVTSNAVIQKLLAAELAGAGYDSMKVGLFTNDVAISPDMVMGDLTPATYVGYAPAVVAPAGDNFDNSAGDGIQLFATIVFQPVSGVTPNDIWGWFLYHDGTPDVLYAVEKFDESVTLAGPLDALPVTPRLMIGRPAAPDSLN